MHVHRRIAQTGINKVVTIEIMQAIIRVNCLHRTGSDSKFATGNTVLHVESDQRIGKITETLRPENVFR